MFEILSVIMPNMPFSTMTMLTLYNNKNMLQYCVFELLVISEAVKMNKIPSSKYP